MKRILISIVVLFFSFQVLSDDEIKVGVLHSLTGTMSISEKSVVASTLFAIDEINAAGGVLGKKLRPVVKDGASNWDTFARQAEVLLTEEKVSVVFGCWTSASRKTVKPVFEKHKGILFYPVQYEGVESSPNIVYTGAAPNQQLLPAVAWSMENLGSKKFFLVGSDYVFPRTANEIIKGKIKELGGEVVGEEYVLLGDHDVDKMVKSVISAGPGVVILNTINGDANVAFFNALKTAGLTAKSNPIISFSIGEPELATMGAGLLAGHYAAWNYFQSIDSKNNRTFVEKFQRKYGSDSVVSDPMEASYDGVMLWKKAVEAAGSVQPNKVLKRINQKFDAPEGMVHIDKENQHLWKYARIGRIREDGQFDILWTSKKSIRPVPYPKYKSKDEWNTFLMDMYKGWNNNWANTGVGDLEI